METTRTRAGFFEPRPTGAQVWVSYAGTNTDILIHFTPEQFTAALRRYEHHAKEVKQSYGMGVLMNFDEVNNLYSFDAVHEGMLITLVVSSELLKQLKGRLYAIEEG